MEQHERTYKKGRGRVHPIYSFPSLHAQHDDDDDARHMWDRVAGAPCYMLSQVGWNQ